MSLSTPAFAEQTEYVTDDAQFVDVPGGKRIHRSCSHFVPDGGRVEGNRIYGAGNKLVEVVKPCRYAPRGNMPVINVWAARAFMFANTWINKMTVTWTVPAPPTTTTPQAVFLWPGIQSTSGTATLLQPVVQWGPSTAGGGAYYAIANWMIVGGTGYHGSLTALNSGDTIQGTTQVNLGYSCPDNGSGCFWDVGFKRNGGTFTSSLFNTTAVFDSVFPAVAEAKNLIVCSQWPLTGSTSFHVDVLFEAGPHAYNFNALTPSFSGATTSDTPNCSYAVSISGANITLTY